MKNRFSFVRMTGLIALYFMSSLALLAQDAPGPLNDPRIHAGMSDPFMPVYISGYDQPSSVQVTVILTNYTYPTSISQQGDYVAGSFFGGAASYYWSAATGVIQVPGTAYGVSDAGLVGGSYSNPVVQYNGSNVETSGTWDPGTLAWTFTGMNPAVPTVFSTDYNTGWDISADGSTVVGMQWYPNYDYSAFKWTQAGGYQMIGNGVGQGSRASGISANGSVVFGWAQVPSASRTPVVWYNGQAVFINIADGGEAFGASPDGNYVTGTLGSDGFRWSAQGTVTFSNTLITGQMSPTTVLNNGTVFGYITTTWPPVPTARRAFARDTLGVMMTFNDYAEDRGLANAQQWIFYSINDGSEDGNTLIGAGKNPSGQDVTFIMEFTEELPVFSVSPQNVDFGQVPAGTQSAFKELVISNAGGGILEVGSVSVTGVNANRFLLQDNNTYPQPLGPGDSITLSVAFAPLTTGLHQAAVEIITDIDTYMVPLSGTGTPGVGMAETTAGTFRVFPVPVLRELCVEFPGGTEELQFYNALGQLCLTMPGSSGDVVRTDVSDLPRGLYRLLCRGRNGTMHSASVMIGN